MNIIPTINDQQSIRLSMLKRAALFACGTKSQELNEFITAKKETNSSLVIHSILTVLSNFIDLPYDFFGEFNNLAKWPIRSVVDTDNMSQLTTNSVIISNPMKKSTIFSVQNNFKRTESILNKISILKKSVNLTSGHEQFPEWQKFMLLDAVLDLISSHSDLETSEGIFRRCGNETRVREALRKSQGLFRENQNYIGQRYFDMEAFHEITSQLSINDLTCMLTKVLNQLIDKNSPLISEKNCQLLSMITELQHFMNESILKKQDWTSCLCDSKQLLGYRCVFNILTPEPERNILNKLFTILIKVRDAFQVTKMSTDSLAKCVFPVLLFPIASNTRVAIDTITNLIDNWTEIYDYIPGLVYQEIQTAKGYMLESGDPNMPNNFTGEKKSKRSKMETSSFASWKRQKSISARSNKFGSPKTKSVLNV